MYQVKRDAPNAVYFSIGMASTVHVVDIHLEQNQRAQTLEND